MSTRNTQKSRLTNKMIDATKAPVDTDSKEYSDSVAIGLKAVVYKTGRKMFYLRYTHQGQKGVVKLGEYPAIQIDEARTLAFEYRAQLDRGINPKSGIEKQRQMPTFAAFAMTDYLPHSVKTKRSHAADESKLRLHLVPEFGKFQMDQITSKKISDFHYSKKETHSPASANRMLMLLSAIYNYAIKCEIVTRNPCVGITQFKENNASTDFLTEEEIRRMLKAMDEESNKICAAALKCLLLTGCRREEILKAKWADFSAAQKNLHLRKTKSGTARYVPLSDEVLSIFGGLNTHEYSEYIFPGRDPSKPLNNPRKCFSRILKAAELGHYRVHSLRHFFGSHAVMAGVSLYEVQKLLGHSSSKTTERYARFSSEKLRASSARVAQVFRAEK